MISMHHRHNDACNDNKKEDKIIKKDVCLAAKVMVTPHVYINEKEVEVRCIEPGHTHLCESEKHLLKDVCEFYIKQPLSLFIPVHFDAEIKATDKGILCPSEEHCHDDYEDYDYDDDDK